MNHRTAVVVGTVVGVTVVGVLVVAFWGVPLERVQVMTCVLAGLLVASFAMSGRPWQRALRDWLPLLAVLIAYDVTRGIADQLGRPVRTDLARIDEALVGVVPSAWLQQHLYGAAAGWPLRPRSTTMLALGPARWWEVAVSLVYVSHFVLPYVLGAVLWWRDRIRWSYWVRRYLAVTGIGLATFVVMPAAPPWLSASKAGGGAVLRTAARGWQWIGLDVADRWITAGQASVNLVAAVPSLHAAHSALVAAALWRCTAGSTSRLRVGVRAFAGVYPVAMGFVLVLTGEHYVVDVLAGWAVTALVVAPDWASIVARVRVRFRRRVVTA